ncbi:LacI family DNA-binding transcriptional regulator [Chelativorans salis]|uniref:LacI family DNA-binding transcriptional regulator n=1 Tax=Chelativorans salis TaxID=2978478 RepID=A0ABT2LGX1_9HYPH|nr:LacI family DNA-binding transcriptional regulator [Chelativorans sp. EGI FJ00035]MCT7373776.1 LacI family DNA-binding transcriptional regulator [Chelativorans sp. EGI FJ00035]
MRKPRRSGKVTLSDVAAAADVSAITVSRALRNPSVVSDDALARIEKAVADLGYVPNLAAQALASKRTNVIGALIPSVTNNVFSDVLRGIYDAIHGTRFQLQLGNTRYSAMEEEKLLLTFLSQRPAGLIVSGIDQSRTARTLLETADCPVVQIMETGPDPVDMMVGFSHLDAARAAVEHLIAAGYSRIAFLGARMDPRTQRRLQGYRQALEQAGLHDESLVVTTPQSSSISLGAHLLGDLLARRPDADAVFCNNDDIALGTLFEAQRRRIPIPGALGICGFNDLEMMQTAWPSLTSVRTHRSGMGQDAVAMLISAIEGRRPDNPVVDLGFEVMARESTRRSPMA